MLEVSLGTAIKIGFGFAMGGALFAAIVFAVGIVFLTLLHIGVN